MTTALYRRYRPETFADVIGQEHVTGPLMQALRTGRVGHAYLFSGPRGCGKTTSARILARCLNCEQGPTPEPCGECESCVALARGGTGSVDVIEIDAASHGGVDDARDLRERAAFGPAQSRFKVYIIDEAHMVTPQGFNALLKVVEEPPEHVKFVFATTEPEKVIGTIRSRTHHYPFRLVPPQQLTDYLQRLCDAEAVAAEPGVLSFVTRAGGGSVRDSLSVLDQLIAGSSEEGLTYAGAAALLGFTGAELLDATIDALAAGDGAATFRQVDKVIESGHDPRRFVEDLLERLRDLIIVAAVQDGAAQVLRGVPEDQLERMRQQAAAFGAGSLSRAADIFNAGLTEMTGATSPRLQLELICARVLLPTVSGEQGYAARLDRLERRLDIAAGRAASTADRSPAGGGPAPVAPTAGVRSAPPGRQAAPPAGAESRGHEVEPPRHHAEGDAAGAVPRSRAAASPGDAGRGRSDAGVAAAPAGPHTPAGQTTEGAIDTDAIRRAWPDVLDRIFRAKRVTWTLLSQHVHVLDYNGERLLLGTSSPGLAQTFSRGQHPDIVRRALVDALGIDVRVEAQADGGGPAPPAAPAPSPGPPGEPRPESGDPHDPPAGRGDRSVHSDGGPRGSAQEGRPASGRAREAARAAQRAQRNDSGGWGAAGAPPPEWVTSPGEQPGPQQPARPTTGPGRAGASAAGDPGIESFDDEDVGDLGEVGIPVITSVLGGTVIDDQRE